MGHLVCGLSKVITLDNLLLSQQVVTSRGISVPYTNLQLNPYPYTQLNLFCSDNLSFSMHISQYVTNQFDVGILVRGLLTNLRKMLAAKFFSSSHYKTLRCTNIAASWKERWTRAYVSGSQYACEKLLHWVASFVTALKTILLYV